MGDVKYLQQENRIFRSNLEEPEITATSIKGKSAPDGGADLLNFSSVMTTD